MSTNLTYLAVLLVIGVLYGLTRPRKGNKRTSWVLKVFPQIGANVPGNKIRPVVGGADTEVNPASPSEIAQILEEIYGDFTVESKRLEVQMTQAVAALRQETQANLAAISDELADLRRQLTPRLVQFERATSFVHDSQAATTEEEVRIVENVKSAVVEVTNANEDPDLKYFNILDALVNGTDPLLICEQLGVTPDQVQMVQRLMSFPLNSPQERMLKRQ